MSVELFVPLSTVGFATRVKRHSTKITKTRFTMATDADRIAAGIPAKFVMISGSEDKQVRVLGP